MKADLENWYTDLEKDQREVAIKLRELVFVQGGNLRKELKWNQPCFYGNSMVCYIQKAKGHMALGFGKGTELADPEELLQGSGKQMRHVRIPLPGDLNKVVLEKLLRNANKLDRDP